MPDAIATLLRGLDAIGERGVFAAEVGIDLARILVMLDCARNESGGRIDSASFISLTSQGRAVCAWLRDMEAQP